MPTLCKDRFLSENLSPTQENICAAGLIHPPCAVPAEKTKTGKNPVLYVKKPFLRDKKHFLRDKNNSVNSSVFVRGHSKIRSGPFHPWSFSPCMLLPKNGLYLFIALQRMDAFCKKVMTGFQFGR